MINKKQWTFLIVNYLIFIICWGIFESGIILEDSSILQIIGLMNLAVHTILILGGEAIIYCVFVIKNDSKSELIIILISLIINIITSCITKGFSDIIIYLSINQVIGIVAGKIIEIIKKV